eukprot:GHVQ01013124.1.p1 GENE.GHVQ01013124.1~~GHVQ01013124.1.p1  ORF type:complete len:331 (+),score=16.61 GHVQ01013124.1:399-1391(+)
MCYTMGPDDMTTFCGSKMLQRQERSRHPCGRQSSHSVLGCFVDSSAYAVLPNILRILKSSRFFFVSYVFIPVCLCAIHTLGTLHPQQENVVQGSRVSSLHRLMWTTPEQRGRGVLWPRMVLNQLSLSSLAAGDRTLKGKRHPASAHRVLLHAPPLTYRNGFTSDVSATSFQSVHRMLRDTKELAHTNAAPPRLRGTPSYGYRNSHGRLLSLQLSWKPRRLQYGIPGNRGRHSTFGTTHSDMYNFTNRARRQSGSLSVLDRDFDHLRHNHIPGTTIPRLSGPQARLGPYVTTQSMPYRYTPSATIRKKPSVFDSSDDASAHRTSSHVDNWT